MDPQHAWRMVIEGLTTDDHVQAGEAAYSLARWINRGGFMPRTGLDKPELLGFLHWVFTEHCDR